MNKALIISGGGSKGAFAVGVVKDLYNTYRLSFDLIVGTSTGALIAPLAAMNDLDTLERLYTTLKTEDLIEKYNIGARLNENALFTANGLGNKIKQVYTDDFYNRLVATGKKIYLTTVCLQTGELVVFTTDSTASNGDYYKIEHIVNADQFRRAVLASASQPVFMPPVKVNKNVSGNANPNHQFVDGGVRELMGVGIALNAGATELFTIVLSAKNSTPDNSEYSDLFSILLKTVEIFVTDVGDNDLYVPGQFINFVNCFNDLKAVMKKSGVSDSNIDDYFNSLNPKYKNLADRKSIKWHIIQPDFPLGGGPGGLVFDPTEMKAMMQTGKNTLQAYVAKLHPGDTDWA